MPLYVFRCGSCGSEEEHLLSMGDRDKKKILCKQCNLEMPRVLGSINYHGEKYQMKAILSDNSKVAGHFGKSAPLLKGKK